MVSGEIPPAPFVKGVANERYRRLNPNMLKMPHNKNNFQNARRLRKNMTPAEKKMWKEVLSRDKLFGLRFLRQKAIGHYIVDFYCSKLLLVIEIDGGQHYTDEGMKYDEERTKDLELFGIKVVRYNNQEVIKNGSR